MEDYKMSVLSELQKINPEIEILPVDDESFVKYGKVLSGIKADKAIRAARKMWQVEDWVDFAVSVPEFEADTELVKQFTQQVYGGMPIEIGWVFGRNNALNGLEYHQGSETAIVLEDVVFLVALTTEMQWNPDAHLNTSHVHAFYAPQGIIVELSTWSMHFVPINVSKNIGFCNLFALPRGTGTPLTFTPPSTPEGKILAATNLWMLAHPEVKSMDDKHPGLRGKNITINQLD